MFLMSRWGLMVMSVASAWPFAWRWLLTLWTSVGWHHLPVLSLLMTQSGTWEVTTGWIYGLSGLNCEPDVDQDFVYYLDLMFPHSVGGTRMLPAISEKCWIRCCVYHALSCPGSPFSDVVTLVNGLRLFWGRTELSCHICLSWCCKASWELATSSVSGFQSENLIRSGTGQGIMTLLEQPTFSSLVIRSDCSCWCKLSSTLPALMTSASLSPTAKLLGWSCRLKTQPD